MTHEIPVIAVRDIDLDGPLTDVITNLTGHLNDIPEEYRPSAYLHVSAELDYGSTMTRPAS